MRGEFIREREALQRAIDEAYAARLIGKNNSTAGISTSMSIAAPAPISAARKPRFWNRWKAKRASRA